MISLQHVSKTYLLQKGQQVTAVQDVSLDVYAGEFVVITGRSGSGKTTLLNLVGGLTRPTSGQVRVEDQEIWHMSDQDLSAFRNRKIGFIFQFPSLIPSLSVMENVLLPTLFGEGSQPPAARQRALSLLEQVGIPEKEHSYPRQLSGGQQQRVVIARALINNPEILLADEPTSDLDEQTEVEILDLIKKIHAESGITVLMVTHSSELVPYGTRALHMVRGELADSPAGNRALSAQGVEPHAVQALGW